MSSEVTCIVTIHGIGFQQPPQVGKDSNYVENSGYADALHRAAADDTRSGAYCRLSPNPEPGGFPENLPIYVTSQWPPPGSGRPIREDGLKRVGSWTITGSNVSIDASQAPLVMSGYTLSHVAVVYTGLEQTELQAASIVEVAALGLPGLPRYTTAIGLLHMVSSDVGLLLERSKAPGGESLLRARTDWPQDASKPSDPGGLAVVVGRLNDEVTGYVCRNVFRARVLGFVQEVLVRLALRSDVAKIVINAHSQGTVIAFDVLRRLPEPLLGKFGLLVTAGSPLRKYITALSWGADVGNMSMKWVNFYDARDPVADQLNPPESWHPATGPLPPPDAGSLFFAVHDDGNKVGVQVTDELVNNVVNAPGGGLRAHNYWANAAEFIPRFCELVNEATEAEGAPQEAS
jgi:hypothetical protein